MNYSNLGVIANALLGDIGEEIKTGFPSMMADPTGEHYAWQQQIVAAGYYGPDYPGYEVGLGYRITIPEFQAVIEDVLQRVFGDIDGFTLEENMEVYIQTAEVIWISLYDNYDILMTYYDVIKPPVDTTSQLTIMINDRMLAIRQELLDAKAAEEIAREAAYEFEIWEPLMPEGLQYEDDIDDDKVDDDVDDEIPLTPKEKEFPWLYAGIAIISLIVLLK